MDSERPLVLDLSSVPNLPVKPALPSFAPRGCFTWSLRRQLRKAYAVECPSHHLSSIRKGSAEAFEEERSPLGSSQRLSSSTGYGSVQTNSAPMQPQSVNGGDVEEQSSVTGLNGWTADSSMAIGASVLAVVGAVVLLLGAFGVLGHHTSLGQPRCTVHVCGCRSGHGSHGGVPCVRWFQRTA
ncbi:hypothetical protein HPB50_004846 [Hyalomma asiaticum]|uniref:Uncharacterized protein n=1 Tax=Hyalomma asiaticum TaxID=266040 RepID=A0ACB7SBS8_HYAAI|nr:hypothetical protein HPB50_004846 [Hyalomma asiaticum]